MELEGTSITKALENASPRVLQDVFAVANCPSMSGVLKVDFDALRERGLVDENNAMPDDVRQTVQDCVKYAEGKDYYFDAPEPVAH